MRAVPLGERGRHRPSSELCGSELSMLLDGIGLSGPPALRVAGRSGLGAGSVGLFRIPAVGVA